MTCATVGSGQTGGGGIAGLRNRGVARSWPSEPAATPHALGGPAAPAWS
jgi:hypothetical protein